MTPPTPPAPLRITLIITRATLETGWQERLSARLGEHWQADLFFMHHGIHQVDQPHWRDLIRPHGTASYCAHGHTLAHGPTPAPEIQPGGLATLGRMIRDSDLALTLPALHWPTARLQPQSRPQSQPRKRIAIRLAGPDETLIEAIRLGAGLAGCDHHVTLWQPASLTAAPWPEAARSYLEALNALGARILPNPPSAFPEPPGESFDLTARL
ncbi:MAG: hypothetical protein HQL99_06700 [Magnetococcales bacterium]|nr:hypothetical protein [Magnetococcales bacterium]